jgi:hypothetical protein
VFAKDGIVVFKRVGAGDGAMPGAQAPVTAPSSGVTASPSAAL